MAHSAFSLVSELIRLCSQPVSTTAAARDAEYARLMALPNSPESTQNERTRPIEDCCPQCGSECFEARPGELISRGGVGGPEEHQWFNVCELCGHQEKT